ncbi:MAG TPA: metallophosphoesterase family protein [Gemmatimonadales bacterium]|nr:metallophosphoesterase family protein [Gemmatimonadales bacterium]HYT82909.1 metallophosphoesterase family protein [Gemmatimonadales bacterium]
MRIAILSDIHANSDALAAVLADVARRGVETALHLGDVVGYHTRPRQTLALLREHGIPGVHGNHDLMALGLLPAEQCGPMGAKAMAWTRRALSDADREYLAGLPGDLRLAGGIICVHSALGDPVVRLRSREQFSEETDVLRRFDPDLRICLTGHTHVPQLVEVGADGVVARDPALQRSLDPGAFCFLNPGSVGLPRDDDERASYAVLDPDERLVSFHRVPYDGRRVARENLRRGIRIGARPLRAGSAVTRLFWSA